MVGRDASTRFSPRLLLRLLGNCAAVAADDPEHGAAIAEQARIILADAEREVAQPAGLSVVRTWTNPHSGNGHRPDAQASAWLHCGGMPGLFFDADERARLADLLDELGPDAPTLLAPWTTRDIAAHLVLRERDSLGAPGLVLPGPWSRLTQRRQAALAARDFTRLVAAFRAGPPPGFFRAGWVRRVPSLNEFFVHHEDVRRANGRGPRTNEQAMEEALWHNVTLGSWYLARRLRGTGLELHWAGTAKTVRARPGKRAARIAGPPGELLLYLFGRQDAAQVEMSGPASAVEAVRRAHLGM